MNFKLSRPGSTGQADNEPAETDPAAETKPVADTPPVPETEPSDVTVPDTTDVPTTDQTPAPRGADTSDAAFAGNAADDALSTSSAQDTNDASPAIAGRDQPSFHPRSAADPVSSPAFTVPPDDDIPLDRPLLPDATQLRANWQQVQASFVDDPHGSVAEAAALVDHAAQSLVGALQQRQRRLRESWDTADGTIDGASLGTEELRVTMQRYRTLFNHICKP